VAALDKDEDRDGEDRGNGQRGVAHAVSPTSVTQLEMPPDRCPAASTGPAVASTPAASHSWNHPY
jgi:hypothetical protein